MAAGIEKRGDGYRASVWSARDNKRIRQDLPDDGRGEGVA